MRDETKLVIGEAWDAQDVLLLAKTVYEAEVVAAHALHHFVGEAEPHNVGLNLLRINHAARDACELLCEESRVKVIYSQLVLPVHERHETACGENTSLAHCTTEHLTVVAGLLYVFL